MNFTQAFDKLQAGKFVTRPGWINGIYLSSMPNVDCICSIYPQNLDNPCVRYSPSINDLIATDWELLP